MPLVLFELSSSCSMARARMSQAFAADISLLARRRSRSRAASVSFSLAFIRHSADVSTVLFLLFLRWRLCGCRTKFDHPARPAYKRRVGPDQRLSAVHARVAACQSVCTPVVVGHTTIDCYLTVLNSTLFQNPSAAQSVAANRSQITRPALSDPAAAARRGEGLMPFCDASASNERPLSVAGQEPVRR
jgi:hypothetical protein